MWTPQTVLANSVIYCTKLSTAEKLIGSPHRQGSKVKTRQNSPNRKNNLSKSGREKIQPAKINRREEGKGNRRQVILMKAFNWIMTKIGNVTGKCVF